MVRKYISQQEELDLIVRAQSGDIDARNRLIQEHLRVINKIVRRTIGPDRYVDEYIGAATLIVMMAIDRFVPMHGNRFMTYAGRCIATKLMDTIRQEGVIRLPYRKALSQRTDRLASNARGVRPLFDSDGNKSQPVHSVASQYREAMDAVNMLRPNHRDVLMSRIRGDTLNCIGDRMQCSRQRVQQIEQSALRSVRSHMGVTE